LYIGQFEFKATPGGHRARLRQYTDLAETTAGLAQATTRGPGPGIFLLPLFANHLADGVKNIVHVVKSN
jgi:hypothetical protein